MRLTERELWQLSGVLAEPEADHQADTPADRLFRRKVWTVIACGLVVFWTVAAGLLAMVLA